MGKQIVIDRRFCGPPNSGNGGYVCGLMAVYVGGAAQVTLHRPPPLERPLAVLRSADRTVRLQDGRRIIAEAQPTRIQIDIPPPPTAAQASAATQAYMGTGEHPFPTCFVCGPRREKNDGLCIFPGPVPDRKLVAAPWRPDSTLADRAGRVRPEFLWAALDCPGGIAVMDRQTRPMLLGRLAAIILGSLSVGDRCTVVGWAISAEGRKHLAGSALFGPAAEPIAYAVGTWIETRMPGSPDRC